MIKFVFPVVATFTTLGLILLVAILPTPELDPENTQPQTAIDNKNNVNSLLPSSLLGDFDAQEPATFKSIEGFSWSQTDDSIANGKSTAWVKRVAADSKVKTAGALFVSGEVKPGFAYPWAGASVGSFRPPIQSYDISDKEKITFDIKGAPGEYRVMFFSSDNKGIPPSQSFFVKQHWQTISLSLTDFPNLNAANFSGLAIVAGPVATKFEFTVDNVLFE